MRKLERRAWRNRVVIVGDGLNSMLTPEDEFAALASRIKAGSREAMDELIEKYGEYVIRAVRRKLSRSLRSKFDSVDFVQSVWASFFEDRDRVGDFPTPNHLVRYLGLMAQSKVVNESRRRLETQKTDVGREVSLERSSLLRSLASPGPTASEVFIAKERAQRMAAGDSIRRKRVIALKRSGHSNLAIAVRLKIQVKAVQRIIRRLLSRENRLISPAERNSDAGPQEAN
jgi:RNA polymerase sigma-70 factor (ECF subfamily)